MVAQRMTGGKASQASIAICGTGNCLPSAIQHLEEIRSVFCCKGNNTTFAEEKADTATKNAIHTPDVAKSILTLHQVVQECLEDACEQTHTDSDAYTGIFIGSLESSQDENSSCDPSPASHLATKLGLQGPSVMIGTGASAAYIALHEACYAVSQGMASSAIAACIDTCTDGSGLMAVYVKPLDAALRDGNPIKATILAIETDYYSSCHDGDISTEKAHENLILRAYEKAGLDPSGTAVVETINDTDCSLRERERIVINNVFGAGQAHINKCKPQSEYTERGRGMSTLFNALSWLDRHVTSTETHKLGPSPSFPESSEPMMSSGRISVSCFGLPGDNVHMIIAPHSDPDCPGISEAVTQAELLLFSANSPDALRTQIQQHEDFCRSESAKAADIAHTLGMRRETLAYRAFSILYQGELLSTSTQTQSPMANPNVVLTFSGQGSQWPGMGAELIQRYPEVKMDLESMDEILSSLKNPPTWSVLEELQRSPNDPTNRVNHASLAPLLCTAFQIALFSQYSRMGVQVSSVIGHSGGEVAAAYVAGYLSLKGAIIIAYHYGQMALKKSSVSGMGAVSLNEEECRPFLQDGVVVGCINSPQSTTLSGPTAALESVLASIKAAYPDVSARKLNIEMAYHSNEMIEVAGTFLQGIIDDDIIEHSNPNENAQVAYYSSKHGRRLSALESLGPEYWSEYLTSPVRFSSAAESLLQDRPDQNLFLEIGPHSALAVPLRQICESKGLYFNYVASQARGKDSSVRFLMSAGRIWQEISNLKMASVFTPGKAISGLPCRTRQETRETETTPKGNERSEVDFSILKSCELTAKQKREQIVNKWPPSNSEVTGSQVPDTEMEIILRVLWTKVLCGVSPISPQSIGKSHNFLNLGGDSLMTIELVSLASQVGIRLEPLGVVRYPELASMAAMATLEENNEQIITRCFDMVSTKTRPIDSIIQKARDACSLSADQYVEDIYPCTALQEGFMALSQKQPGSYIHRWVYKVPQGIDPIQFKAAWTRVVQKCGSLRSRICVIDDEQLQVVVENDTSWEEVPICIDAQAYVNHARSIKMTYGERLTRFALLQQEDGDFYFVWIIHHSAFDGLTMKLVLDGLYHAYYGHEDIGLMIPYSTFIRYIQSLDSETARKYWEVELQGSKPARFPQGHLSPTSKLSGRVKKMRLPFQNPSKRSITTATFLRAAWALVLAEYCETDDICFGSTVSGRQAALPGLSEIPGPMIATVPVRVKISKGELVSAFLDRIQSQSAAMVPFEQFGLQNISKLGQEAQEACDFSNLIVIQPIHHLASVAVNEDDGVLYQGKEEVDISEEVMNNYFNYPLVFQPKIGKGFIEMDFTYYSDLISENQLDALYHHLKVVIEQLLAEDDRFLDEISVCGPWDLNFAENANSQDTQIVDACFHELFESHAKRSGSEPAIDAWDLTLTYNELNDAATRLSHHLVQTHGVQPNDLVHVCFDKSGWFYVAILAINKAGAAWVPLDPSHPLDRLQQVVSQTQAKVILASQGNSALSSKLMEHVLVVGPELNWTLQCFPVSSCRSVEVSPEQAVYVLFTSGSTGKPKGFVMQHRAVCTSQREIAKRLGMNSRVRILQFSSYVFDLSIGEIIAPLISGACVCIPSEDDRMNRLPEFIREKSVTWAFQTPAFLRTMNPEDVPGLELVLLAGEAVGQDILDVWVGKVRLLNGWGPAETCVASTIHEFASTADSPKCIGRPVGGHCWIVNPDDPSQLAPIGTVGEVIIQGPTLLKEYLADQLKTQATILQDTPAWMKMGSVPGWQRCYKTGDLCRYNFDGTLEFMSRKDTQVKIRGMRIELEEIETHIREHLHDVRHVVVDVVKSGIASTLIAYLCFSDELRPGPIQVDNIFKPPCEDDGIRISMLIGQLSAKLPKYMIPSHVIHCRHMPSTSSTKLDRRSLNTLTATLSAEMLEKYSRFSSEKRKPETPMEIQLQSLWAKILQLPCESIGRDDSFLHIGGDSIAIIKLISLCRSSGILLSTKDVFDNPTLIAVAKKAAPLKNDVVSQATKSLDDLIDDEIREKVYSEEMKEYCQLSVEESIEDVFPCSAMQEGLMAMTEKQPGSYIAKYVYRIRKDADIGKIKYAWESAIELCPNTRSRIVFVEGRTVQLVISGPVIWEHTSAPDPTSYIEQKDYTNFGYGTSLSRYTILSCQNENYLIWTAHHALYDGWSLGIFINTFERAYMGLAPDELKPYPRFIKYVMDVDSEPARQYWTKKLAGSKQMTFPLPPDTSELGATRNPRTYLHSVGLKACNDSSITSASIIRAAWAILLSQYCDSDDICFGATVSGRQAPVPGIEAMAGPTIATIPVRLLLDGEAKVGQFLHSVQSDALNTIPFEQLGLKQISRLSQDTKTATDFSTLLVVQPTVKNSDKHTGGHSVLIVGNKEQEITQQTMGDYFEYPLALVSNVFDDHVEQRFSYDEKIISQHQIVAIANHLDHVMQQLLVKLDDPLSSISLVGQWDLEHAIRAQRLCEPVRSCTHWLIQDQIKQRPNDPAVVSWDANLTYAELGLYASWLASKLQTMGVGPESLVPFCFPKSAWAVVTMVAVQMAGGAFVPLDPAAPATRLQDIVIGSKAKLVISDPVYASKFEYFSVPILVVDEASLQFLPSPTRDVPSSATPDNASFVIFTSGSTGRPKGILIQHDQICTSITKSYGYELGLGPGSRVFNFCAFTFDLGIFDVIGTLMKGGCVCMPSEDQRMNDLAGAMRQYKANWLFCTPTVANLLYPEEVPLLKVIGLGGEAITKKTSDRWKDHVQLNGLYGPAEGSSCARNPDVGRDDRPTNIGVPMSSAFWVVKPSNIKELVPVGCIGELLIQGPMLARGYVNVSPEQASVWMDDVDWLPGQESPCRAYRTGDLVRRNADGTYEYMGRKDSQVKINGQRLELGEVETRIYEFLPNEVSAIVELGKNKDGSTQGLMALMWYTNSKDEIAQGQVKLLENVTPEVRSLVSDLDTSLKSVLPSYMIPSTYLVFQGKPDMSTSGKVDRKTLLNHALRSSQQDRLRFAPEASKSEPPITDMEVKMTKLWAQVLSIEATTISRNDNFLRVGGDSISAIQLVARAREQGIELTVRSIFDDPRLHAIALCAIHTQLQTSTSENIQSFSLLPLQLRGIDWETEARATCSLKVDQVIENAMPVTPFQEGLMALSVKQPRSHIAQWVYKLSDTTDINRFINAWGRTVCFCRNLRTRIVNVSKATLQLVIANDGCWDNTDGVDVATYTSRKTEMTFGSRLAQWALIKQPGGEVFFILKAQHAIYDGWTMTLVYRTLAESYFQIHNVWPQPLDAFIKYTQELDQDDAKKYWLSQLEDATVAKFPPRPRKSGAREISTMKRKLELPKIRHTAITQATVMRAAWALLLSRYCESDNVCFGTSVSGRQAPVPEITNLAGPVVGTLPIHVRIDPQTSVNKFLGEIQTQASKMIAYEQYGLHNIMKLSTTIRDACQFSSLLVIQPLDVMAQTGHKLNSLFSPVENDSSSMPGIENFFSYPLVFQVMLSPAEVHLHIIYDALLLSPFQITALTNQFGHIVQTLCDKKVKNVSQLPMASPWDVDLMRSFNSSIPEVVESTIHELVSEQATLRPQAIAVNAWDSVLTYSELDTFATYLASFLVVEAGVKRGDLVHVCFEKSAFYTVSILAINKAGAGWVPLDPSHPIQRQQQVVSQTRAKLMLTSPKYFELGSSLVQRAVQISLQFLNDLLQHTNIDTTRHISSPDDICYVLFTSGSTGVPKGLVMQHRAVCTSQREIRKRLGITPTVKMLQFSSHVFDLSVLEILGALTAGALLYVPSDDVRIDNTAGYIHENGITWAIMTPSFARTINPDAVPSLKTLLLGGEMIPQDVFENWVSQVRLVNGWGPAETCCLSAIHEFSPGDSPQTIGRPVGGLCWLVDLDDHQKLVPTGTLGEMIIQGPTLLREYLSDPKRTAESTMQKLPPWASHSNTWTRGFLTRDLAFYNSSGLLEFSGRKDTQVKIRGLRVELGEIEHQIRLTLPTIKQLSVDLFKGKSSSNIVAFICLSEQTRLAKDADDFTDMFEPLNSDLEEELYRLRGILENILPGYMVPTLYIPCKYMPFVASCKLDRRTLRECTSKLSSGQLQHYALAGASKEMPRTATELQIQSIWATLFDISKESIGRDDSFFRIGGDSITAIHFVSAARDAGLELKTKDIFDDPRLLSVASRAVHVESGHITDSPIKPFSLISQDLKEAILNEEVRLACHLSREQSIENAYPVTAFQEALIALAAKQPRSYIAKWVYRIIDEVDLSRFRSAWEYTVRSCPNLRSRIIREHDTTVQINVKEDISWEDTSEISLSTFLEEANKMEMVLGSRLNRYALIQDPNGKAYFVLIAHHASYDGWTLQLMLRILANAYNGQFDTPKPFDSFIKHITGQDKQLASEFWKQTLDGAKPATFPRPPKVLSVPNTKVITNCIKMPSNDMTITQATIVRATWAIVLARHSDTDDITFGTSVSGRQAPVAGLDRIPGPAVATLPVRIKLDPSLPISDFLKGVQLQASDMIQYEQFGLQNIGKLGPDFKAICDFGSLLVIQPHNKMSQMGKDSNALMFQEDLEDLASEKLMAGYFTMPLVFQTIILEDSLEYNLTYDSNVVSETQASSLLHQIEHVMKSLAQYTDKPLSSISVAGEWDLKQALVFNEQKAEFVESTLHEMVSRQAKIRPDAIAVKGWDGTFSYEQLDACSDRLANYLVSSKLVNCRDFVHVCFEKSVWYIVAIIAINKAGAAWVPLDPSHPKARHQLIIQQTGSEIVLASPKNVEILTGLVATVLPVSSDLDEELIRNPAQPEKDGKLNVSPRDPCYVLFTSGSTGTPKGFVMEHHSVCSAQTTIFKRFGLSSETKVLQFSSYVFDMSIGEILGPLICGASVYVPSEADRMGRITEFIQENAINSMWMTPSFARTIKPEDVPSIKFVVFAGESVGQDVFDSWVEKVRLINGWGPAETSCLATFHEWKSRFESPMTIGKPLGINCWIVDPDDPYKLAPIGATGEAVIQGPHLLREYLANPKENAKRLRTNLPGWAPRAKEELWGRFYLSGDLCHFNSSGLLEFVSRKDTQIKIRGLRVEVGEVETQIQNFMPQFHQIAVDVFSGPRGSHLFAYLFQSGNSRVGSRSNTWDDMFLPIDADLYSVLMGLVGHLRATLPKYMVPTAFIPCSYIPLNTSSKLDRNTLHGEAKKLDQAQISHYSLQDAEKRSPVTPMETMIQKLWADTLKITVDSIGRDDSFFALGGDSIAVINLMVACRKKGISMDSDKVFRHPQLKELALHVKLSDALSTSQKKLKPFELLNATELDAVQNGRIHTLCNISAGTRIEDAFPCTPLQEGLISLSVKQTGSYITKYVFQIPPRVDLKQFKDAWEQTILLNLNLRTRIVDLKNRPIQVIVQNTNVWEPTEGLSLTEFIDKTKNYEMTFGSRLNRYAVVSEKSGTSYFVWVSHHSIMDGWTLQLTFRTLYECYWQQARTKLYPYSLFIKHVLDLDHEAATNFWKLQLQDASRPSFPSTSQNNTRPVFGFLRHTISMPGGTNASFTSATILRAAWSIVLAHHCNADDICFGATVAGRNASLEGLQDMPGLTIATVPVRIRLDRKLPVKDFLDYIQKHAAEMAAFEQFGLQNISRVSKSAKEACQFSNLVVIRPKPHLQGNDESDFVLAKVDGVDITEQEMVNYYNYPLILESDLSPDCARIRLSYDTHVLSKDLVEAIANQFDFVVQQLHSKQSEPIDRITLVGPWDTDHALRHQNMKPSTDLCIHEMIRTQIKATPALPALTSWDGDMTYAEVGSFVERLADKLKLLGVGPETFVLICFPKSIWAVISMIAINMAGGAFVPLDPMAPVSRLKSISDDTKSKIALAAPSCIDIIQPLGIEAYSVDRQSILEMPEPRSPVSSSVNHTNASFVMFTSGSTGKPKGMVFEHRNICSTSNSHGEIQGWGPGTRVFTYSAYTFDIGVIDVMVSLSRGACLCIPSDWQRYNDIAGAINAMQANWSFFTPTLAGMVNPVEIPTIRNVGLGGENVTKQVVDNWRGRATLHNLYGPAEASICGWIKDVGIVSKPSNIGIPSSCAWWVVKPDDYKQLVPVGCIGELMIQGPMMARGYINASESANKAWLYNVDWLPGTNVPKKAYLTGDLVRRLEDGTFEYLGRKDTQIKLHGQRVELGEIESRLEEKVPSHISCIVDTIINEETKANTLVALLWFIKGPESKSQQLKLADEVTDEMRALIGSLESSLALELPPYMIPSMYLIFQGIPERNSSGKVDRRKLCSVAQKAPAKDRLRFSSSGCTFERPQTDLEIQLSNLWAGVLRIEANEIGRNDSFLKVGGDSISAIRLVTVARENGLALEVAKIFADPRLFAMAAAIKLIDEEPSTTYEPFGLIKNPSRDTVIQDAVTQCGLQGPDQIEDIFPCTSLQTGLIALSVKQPGSYIARIAFRLAKSVDIRRFKDAWKKTGDICPNLRTRIIQTHGTTLQVVLKEDFVWEDSREIEGRAGVEAVDRSVTMSYGQPLSRFVAHQDSSGGYTFTHLVHHTIFDGWTNQLIMKAFSSIYCGHDTPKMRPFSDFISYLGRTDESATRAFWEKQLRGAQRAQFPLTPNGSTGVSRVLQKSLSFPRLTAGSVTGATVLRAAWALLLAKYCGSDDITFAATISGRNAPVPDIANIPGAMIATVPIRVKVDKKQTVRSFLEKLQQLATETIAYEQYGLQNIAKVSEDAKEACQCSSLAVVQSANHFEYFNNQDMLTPLSENKSKEQNALQGYFTYPLVMEAAIDSEKVEFYLIYDEGALEGTQADAICHQYEQLVFELLSENSAKCLKDVSMVSPWDMQTATDRNSIPEVVDACMHDIISARASVSPYAPAVHAWDGDFTYEELDGLSNRVACCLISRYQVQVGDIVHICMSKSKWYLVLILAINKAGAAFSPIDPDHPLQRKQSIVQQTNAKVIFASTEQAEVASSLVQDVIPITNDFFESLSLDITSPLSMATPDDISYVLFTSGSTGTPKGFTIDHRSFCTSLHALSEAIQLPPSARVLQFANVVFDFSIGEIFLALYAGGSICVPSEEDRLNNIQGFIRDSAVNTLLITPSFARTIIPEQVPSVHTVAVGGEAMTQDVFDQWFGKVRFMNVWGPGEICVGATVHEFKSRTEPTATIGKPFGAKFWIVDPENPRELAPIGTVGEILIQGPTVTRGYLGNPEKTKEAILTDLPTWANGQENIHFSRAYKSGDLAFYNPDGSIQFVGRKDTQIKIRGLRVELGEIEHHVLSTLEGVEQVAVDVHQAKEATNIVAYISFSNEIRIGSELDELFLNISSNLRIQLMELCGKLKLVLPSYMVPSMFIPCRFIPIGVSSKLDRRGLQNQVSKLSTEQMQHYSLVTSEKRAPESGMESRLRDIWAKVLHISVESIGRDDSFLQIGGNSITAIHLVSAAREAGIAITVQHIFDDPRLYMMASQASEIKSANKMGQGQELEPFGLLPGHLSQVDWDGDVAEMCNLSMEQLIENAMPVTSTQQSLMARSVEEPTSNISTWVFKISQEVDIGRFRDAWKKTIISCQNLRTRVVQVSQTDVQVIVANDGSWERVKNLDLKTYLDQARQTQATYGSRLSRWALIDESSEKRFFVLTAHHAVCDEWALSVILRTLSNKYYHIKGQNPQSFDSFIQYTESIDRESSRQYWQDLLLNGTPTSFLTSRLGSCSDVDIRTSGTCINLPDSQLSTNDTVLRASWALLLFKYRNEADVFFCTSNSGRNAPVAGICDISGPTNTIVPFRIHIDPSMDVSTFLDSVKAQTTSSIPFEQHGINYISQASSEFQEAYKASSLLCIQPQEEMSKICQRSGEILTLYEDYEENFTQGQEFAKYPLVVKALVSSSEIHLKAIFNASILSNDKVNGLISDLGQIISSVATTPTNSVRQILE